MVSPIIHILRDDPNTTHRLNACVYQQSAIITFSGWQYVAFYATSPHSDSRLVTLARRDIQAQASWQYLTFEDYEKTTDDGHNTISMGICPGDASIHLSFDHHCDVLNYRISCPGLASHTDESNWRASSFGPIQNYRPGQEASPLVDITYPRFIPAGQDLYFECRIGKAAAGSEILHRYNHKTSKFSPLGAYLVGQGCNPYPNGVSFYPESNALYITWTNRHFINYEGAQDERSTAHKAQAGPNGPENNEGLYHAHTLDAGATWLNSHGEFIASLLTEDAKGLGSQDERLKVKHIPRNSGIMNQEAQYVDVHGGLHVLNRENTTGQERWVHYYRGPVAGGWISYEIPVFPIATGSRGKVISCGRTNAVYFVLPSNTRHELIITRMRGGMQSPERDFEILWRREGYLGEPLIDDKAFLRFGMLSIFILFEKSSVERKVVVLQFGMNDLS